MQRNAPPKGQVWLTTALTDSDVMEALTLCLSLRRALTSHKVAVIVCLNISGVLRESLEYYFDFVFTLDEKRNTAGLEVKDFAKLFALTLQGFKKCVMLSPNMLVVRNCDELFDTGRKDSSQPLVWCSKGEIGSVLVIRPSLQVFKDLLKGIAKRGGTGVDTFLKKWLMNQTPDCEFLGEKYNQQLFENGILLQQEKDISIINLKSKPSIVVMSDNLGFVGERVAKLWETIREEAVLPLLKALENPELPDPQVSEETINMDAIAIIGMSCRYPSSNNLEEFWQVLLQGKDGTGNPPEFRWLREQCSRTKADCRKTNAGFLKCPIDDFDAKFFGISPKEMVSLDPQHRLLHELVWEGLEDAAIDPSSLEGTNGGVFIGSWLNDYKDILNHAGENQFYRAYMGNSIGAGAARISHLLGLTGPSIATESGCSSAMVAVHLACKSLQRNETNMALACGVNLLLHQFDQDEMPMVVSPEGRCKTFDAKADGFARGEGCGVLVLKRLSDAFRDGDKIWALIRGTGMTQEGVSKSMGTPTVHCESLAMKQALQDAGVDPALVSYVETHGTGTVVGDPMEVASIAKAYHSKQRKEPLLIGSVKTNVGHTESCSGITGMMKVVLAMYHEIIPPHRNFETLNPSIDLEAVPAKIPLEPVTWAKQEGNPRLAGVSSFGITGTDAHAILQEPPTFSPRPLSVASLSRPLHLLKISAKTKEALEILVERYKEHLGGSKDELSDIAYTGNVGRANFSHRAVLIAKSNDDGARLIEQNKLMIGEETPDNIGKICFLFTGQGSQYPGMGKQLFETSPVFRMHFEYCQKILKNTYNIDIAQVLWSEAKSNEVSRTIYSQTSIFCIEYALLKLWESWGVKADFALGHSLGEFAAAVCAGVLSVEDAIKLVAERSRLIDELPHGKMLVIKAEKQKVDSLMKRFAENDKNKMLDFAAINSKEQTVVAGDSEVILEFSECCKNNGLKCIVLEATHAFHSKHMDPMLEKYGGVAKTVKKLSGNDCKYISGMRGTLVDADQIDKAYWVQHTRENVLFLDASKTAVELGCKTFIEIGPQPVLAALTMINNEVPLTCLPSLKRNGGEWETLFNTLGKLYLSGLKIDWEGVEQFCDRKKVSLPHYPFIGKKFWPDLLAVTGSIIHPLVGTVLTNASSTKIFQNGLNLRAMEYIKDHAIGENVIFPGAGYLEMCLVAGLATIEGSTDSLSTPTRAMKIENLVIQAPLLLQDEKTCQVQTIVDYNTLQGNEQDWNDLSIKIFHKQEGEASKWLSHAQATFSPLPSAEEKSISIDLQRFKETLEKPSNDSILSDIYDNLASVGLRFGPSFRSIEKLWRDEDNDAKSLLAKVKVSSSEEQSQSKYILHPVVIDAMIQAVLMLCHTSTMKKKLHVPIKVGKFVWLSEPDSSSSTELYIHAFSSFSLDGNSHENDSSAVLVDSSGKALALMSSVEFIDTTVKAIESVLQQQTNSLPEMWESIWRPTESPADNTLDLSDSVGCFYTNEFEQRMETDYNTPPPFIEQTFNTLSDLVYFNYLRTFYELGWKPKLHQTFREKDLLTEFKIQQGFRKYFGSMCDVLASEGMFQKVGEEEGEITWKMVKNPPEIEVVLSTLSLPTFTSDLVSIFKPTLLYSKFVEKLAEILRGTQSVLPVLFPEENKGWPSVSDFYWDYGQLFKVKEFGGDVGIQRFTRIQEAMQKNGKRTVRILEVGAGTGSYTSDLIKSLEALNITDFEYTYTDISAAFFPAAQKRFEKLGKSMKFKRLNIEEDPIEQGFTPEYFDYIYMAEVIHATRDIKESLRNLRMLMKPWAKLDMIEQTRVNRLVTSLFGPLEGFWRFQDFDLRPKHCTLSKEVWAQAYQESGFGIDGIFSVLNNYHSYVCVHKTPDERLELPLKENVSANKVWLMFHHGGSPVSTFLREKIGRVGGRKVITITEGNFEENVDGFQVMKDKEEDYANVFRSMQSRKLTVEGILYCWGLDEKRLTQEEILQPYFYVTKAFLNLKLRVQPRVIVLTKCTIPLEDNELSNVHLSTLWAFTKSLKNEHQDVNCRAVEIPNGPLDEVKLQGIFYEIWNCDKEVQVAFQGTTRYVPRFMPYKPFSNALNLPKGTDRFQLILPATKAISDLTFGPLDTVTLEEDEVEVQIKASALNFKDVLSVIKPSETFKDMNAVGFDFAGVVKRIGENVTKWKVGDKVIGCNKENIALPSHARLHQDFLISLPENATFNEAVTIPAVYVTSVVCLLETAKIKKGDVVLLHTATGGVGLSAIELCKHIGCSIIATAGSKRKQNYLRSLGIQHIFHSRNTKFGDDILKLTNGRGVDVVLNSLTSEGFKEATLKACAKGARFVEMSKLNVWTPEEVKELRPDVSYTIIDVSSADASEWTRFLGVLRELMVKKIVKPIPYVRFDGLNVREALQYMQKAKHIGKIVCVMPELRNEGGEMQIYTPMFNDSSTYLITGGLGGIGFEVCKWILELGGKHVILASRSPPSSSMQIKIKGLNSEGANVIPVQLDVSNFEQCKELIQTKIKMMKLPPLRGIMHAAGIINDAMIENQDWGKLSSTFGTKINGTVNLHDLTKDLPLEHFVTFSSTAALFGPPGQCNHAAANMFEDNFMHYRNSIGLPGTTVNWGQWGEVGVATEVDIPGLNAISNLQGIGALEYVLKTQRSQTTSVNISSFVILSKFVPYLGTYLDERMWKKTSTSNTVGIQSDEFWEQYDSKTELEEKTNVLKAQIQNILRTTLKLDDGDSIDDHLNFQDMGVDSLMFVEIKNSLQMLFGDRLTINASTLKDCSNASDLTQTLVRHIEGTQLPTQKPTPQEANDLIREDCHLPEHIAAKPGQTTGKTRDIKRVFLTGCTGTLGPYVLMRLTAMSQISQVVCLMRPSMQESANERLRKILEKKGVINQINMEKVRTVAGNVALKHFGLEPEVWLELTENIDAVAHCAAHVDHTEYYRKKESNSDTRAVNIQGTRNILEFACEGRLKQVYIASSLLSVAKVDEEGRTSEDWPEIGDFDGMTSHAYPISKFVADYLVKEGVERGIPCKVFRLPLIVGESKSGRCEADNNHVLMRYMFIMKNGLMPSVPLAIPMLPADTCADLSLQLFFDENALPDVYNICHTQPDVEQEFVHVAKKLGHNVAIVELSEFTNCVKKKSSGPEGKNITLSIFEELYSDEESFLDYYAKSAIIQQWIEGNTKVWLSKKVPALIPNAYDSQQPTMNYIYTNLLFLQHQGVFKKFGL
ncbi:unnamed protein product [Orchesella dallaii]|uniref:Erythronolide synthase, modules 3 and 4 n=1 Tax=Orchesella dallaii TaxID=48710 RepID=A0ABP1Q124_9HEXA